MNIMSMLLDLIKDTVENYVDSAKEYMQEVAEKVYVFIIISVICTAMFCFSVGAFIIKLGDALDQYQTFIWLNSMTLYSLTALLSLALLHYSLNRRNKFSNPSLENEIEEVIKKHTRKKTNRRRK